MKKKGQVAKASLPDSAGSTPALPLQKEEK